MDFTLTAGRTHDVNAVDELLADVDADAFIADKAYDADGVIDTLKARNIRPVIPSGRDRKVQRDYDKQMCKERNLVERFFKKSNNSEVSPRATKNSPPISWPVYTSPPQPSCSKDDTP